MNVKGPTYAVRAGMALLVWAIVAGSSGAYAANPKHQAITNATPSTQTEASGNSAKLDAYGFPVVAMVKPVSATSSPEKCALSSDVYGSDTATILQRMTDGAGPGSVETGGS
ncbi:MAG: hypothetical protein AWU57_19 [Marinobacter sp. T13-3]|nr:MAG: hypothetical protein AWU57_19 [Marinobacter sp. T13-3]